MGKHRFCCRPVSVHLSVTFVTFIYFIQMAKDIVRLLDLVSPSFYFLIPSASTQFQGEPLKYTEGGKIVRFSTEIAVYLTNGMR